MKVDVKNIDPNVYRRLKRGKDQGYIKGFEIKNGSLYIYFIDEKYSKDLKIPIRTVYDERNKPTYHIVYGDWFQFTDMMNKIGRKYVKDNVSKKTVIGHDNKEHDISEILNMLKKYDKYNKILEIGFVTECSNTGAVKFFEKEFYTPGDDDNHAKFTISKNGKISENSRHPIILWQHAPLNHIKDYEEACDFIYDKLFTKQYNKWKKIFNKDPNIALEEMPSYLRKLFIGDKLDKVNDQTGMFESKKEYDLLLHQLENKSGKNVIWICSPNSPHFFEKIAN